ncbi:MAG: ribonuclease P protein component [Hyphomicrobiaceae bacterium]|nr:ribonuclease P protein component [Hyphomicrobiaceae bacterium]
MAYPTIKKRSEFLAVRGGARWSTSSVTVEARQRRSVMPVGAAGSARSPDEVTSGPAATAGHGGREPFRFGYTVTKKLGGAVKRNRIRRRLRAAVEQVAGTRCKGGFDYVLFARSAALDCEFGALTRDLAEAFERVHRPRRDKRGPKPG